MKKAYKTIYYPILISVSLTPVSWAKEPFISNAGADVDVDFAFAMVSDGRLNSLNEAEKSCDNVKKRIAWLEEYIANQRVIYYSGSKPKITDAEFDFMVSELAIISDCRSSVLQQFGVKSLALNEQIYNKNSSNQRQSPKIQLSAEMRSLKSVRDDYLMAQFYRQHSQNSQDNLILQPKIDGVAVELVYRKGKLVAAATRGDGEQGKNIIDLVLAMNTVPSLIAKPLNMILHGELYVKEQQWIKRNKYVSARHMAAGITHQNNPHKRDIQSLHFMPWRWIDSPLGSEINSLFLLSELGFENMASLSHEVSSIAELQRWFKHYAVRDSLPVKLDGIVVKIAQRSEQDKLGHNSQAPKWALAQKFIGPRGTSKVTGIIYQTGESGRITPVVRFQPLILAGHSINKASGHSQPWLDKMQLVVGSEVEIELVGHAIPQLIRVLDQDSEL